MGDFHKPITLTNQELEQIIGAADPKLIYELAHRTAHTLVSRIRENPNEEVLQRITEYSAEHGLEAIAELWSHSSAKSLPGTLWRIYNLHSFMRKSQKAAVSYYRHGLELVGSSVTNLSGVDELVAGVAEPISPENISATADQILRGVFSGDFSIALVRAAAFCRLIAKGSAATAPKQSKNFEVLAGDLEVSARLWDKGKLD